MRPDETCVRERAYRAALRTARPLLSAVSPLDDKLARGLAGRRGAGDRLAAWGAAHAEPDRPLVWVHAPSVGEALMAQAIIAALRERAPEVRIAFTHFSPSAERMAARVGGDVHDYLPWDLPREVERALGGLRPDVVAFVRTEAWPTLSLSAARRGARLALVNAILPRGSSRLRPHSRFMLGPTYRRLDAIGAVAKDDARRFSRFGIPLERVRVTGDARFDQVLARVRALRPDEPLLEPLRDRIRPTLVAGSTWGPDEERLVPAFAAARRQAAWRLIAAPHEPDEPHLRALEARLDEAGLAHARLAEVEAGTPAPDVVVVDRVGVLADLYALADVAYVGGGFHSAGVHSVVEPAALAVPVLFGPRHENAREAGELTAAGGAFATADVEDLTRLLDFLARDAQARRTAGAAAEAYVQAHAGAAAANAELLLGLLRR